MAILKKLTMLMHRLVIKSRRAALRGQSHVSQQNIKIMIRVTWLRVQNLVYLSFAMQEHAFNRV